MPILRHLVATLLILLTSLATAQEATSYVLGPGDQVAISVFGEADLSMQFTLSDAGALNYPFLGEIRVAGLTMPGLEQLIADGLRGAGAQVDAIAFYENRRPRIDVAGLRDRLVRGDLFALTFTSPSTVDHFMDCLDDESREAAGQCMIAAIGRTTATALERAGLTPTVMPARPDVSLMVEELVAAASR